MLKEVLLLFLKKMVKTRTLEESVRQSETDREQAIRLSRETHKFVQPTLDWYQFTSEDALSFYIAEICTIRGFKVTYAQVRHLVSGEIRYKLDDPIKWVHSAMSRMHEPTLEGRREEIPITLKIKYVLPNDEPLPHLIERALVELIGKADEKAKESIEAMLKNDKKVRRPSGLVERIKQAYGFASIKKIREFLSEIAELDPVYYLDDLKSSVKSPLCLHRKTFAVAAVLDYAWKNGFRNKAIEAILEHARKRSTKEQGHLIYLAVPRSKYMKLIKAVEDSGLKGHPLTVVISQVVGISINNADDYIAGRYNIMDLDYYLKLEEFVKNALPNIRVVDLSRGKTRQAEYWKFLRFQKGSKVLITYIGPTNQLVNDMVQKIRDEAYGRLMIPFLYDKHNAVKVARLGPHTRILADSKYA